MNITHTVYGIKQNFTGRIALVQMIICSRLKNRTDIAELFDFNSNDSLAPPHPDDQYFPIPQFPFVSVAGCSPVNIIAPKVVSAKHHVYSTN